MALKIILMDDPALPAQDQSIWMKIWNVVKQIAPMIIPAATAIFNPTQGHMEVTGHEGGVRPDRINHVYGDSHYAVNGIDSSFIKCFLNPEIYRARRPGLGYETSLICSTVAIPVYVNASGNGAIMVLPQNCMNNLTGEFINAGPVISGAEYGM